MSQQASKLLPMSRVDLPTEPVSSMSSYVDGDSASGAGISIADDSSSRAGSTQSGSAPVTPVSGERPSAIRFAECVRSVVTVARRRGLRPPVFRSPPRLESVDRTIRRQSDGGSVISIRLTGRPFAAVQSDVVEGVVVANELIGEPADRFRRAAWESLSAADAEVRFSPKADAVQLPGVPGPLPPADRSQVVRKERFPTSVNQSEKIGAELPPARVA